MSELARLISDKYFACAPRKDISRVWTKLDQLTSRPHPMAPKWLQADLHYFGERGPAGVTWGVTRGGVEGELAQIRVNYARAFVKAKISLITASQVRWAIRAKQDSAAADLATSLSRCLIEDVWQTNGLAAADVRWEELAQVYAEGTAFLEWDRTRGPDAMVDARNNTRTKAGDVRLSLLPPWLVLTDNNRDSAEDQDWWFVRVDRPKADLVMLYPELADGRKGTEAANAIFDVRDERRLRSYGFDDSQDLGGVVHFIHRPCGVLPLGRHIAMLNGDVVLRDTPLIGDDGDYERTPIIRRASDERVDTPFAWTSFFDVLGAQEILDCINTTQSTITTTYGNPILAKQEQTKWDTQDATVFGRSLTFPVDAKLPGYILPPRLEDSHLKYAESLIDAQQRILSLNDAALGQSTGAEKNAQADALAASMAVQAAGPAVLARRRSLSELGMVWLTTLRHNVDGKRMARMAGAGEQNLIEDTKMWTGTDLGPLDVCEVEEISPEEATPQGRAAITEQYMQMGIVKTADDLEEVRNTGRLNRIVDPIRDEGILIEQENEQLAKGQKPLVHPTQNALKHYPANASVLLSMSALSKQEVLAAVQDTLDQRYFYYFGVWPNGKPAAPDPTTGQMAPPLPADPLALDRRRYLMGQGPLPTPMPPPGPQQDAGGLPPPPPDTGLAPPAKGQPSPSPAPGAPPINGPKNPLTGAQFSPTSPPIQ